MNLTTNRAVYIFALGFITRVIASVVTTTTNLNPDSTADAIEFGNTAELIARGLQEGHPFLYTSGSIDVLQLFVPLVTVDIYQLWGLFLAPFWLLPGPSGFYARLGNAFLGAFAVYNIYLLACYYHSHHAGVVASFPLIFYPSIVAVHSTLLREAIVLFGITTTVRLLVIPSNQRSRLLSYVFAGATLYLSLLQRSDNIFIFVAVIIAVFVAYAIEFEYISKRVIGLGIISSPVVFVLALPIIRNGIEFLSRTRQLRIRGRAVYFPETIPSTVFEFIAFSWIGALYFLYAPFPWMIQTIPDLLVSLEGLVSIVFTIAAIYGVRIIGQKNTPVTIGLLVGLVVAAILYGVGTANYGTAMRHRQMFIWIIFLFGGIGFSEYVKFVWPLQKSIDRNPNEDPPVESR